MREYESMKVIINYNTEIGKALYSVTPINDLDNWIKSFKYLKNAVLYCEREKLEIQKLRKTS